MDAVQKLVKAQASTAPEALSTDKHYFPKLSMYMNPKLPPQRKKLSAARKGGAAAGAAGVAALLWHVNVESSSKPASIWVGEGDLKEKVRAVLLSKMQ
ncbi:hypothetical protein DUNSADRAFT_10160 [Dunaliella salina]|uniref:Uncharacterized protein n=1 Tax=Dunaliella salina TaxID=3046 RepID=A0ABQ7GFX7_DUNSA|nr:hypothetical protein DUNSADRAFT_10160 [Dunaliella salina]|eukprot:KAF5833509.1 hypothetical protein DUNSADRAFT_10160 [Dunaliella salina]